MLTRRQAEIKLDVDEGHPPDLQVVSQLLERAGYRIETWTQQHSPGGTGWHVIIEVSPRPTTAMEVTALQAICGSDPWREAVNVVRARSFVKAPKFMRDRWNVLYRSDKARSRHLTLNAEA